MLIEAKYHVTIIPLACVQRQGGFLFRMHAESIINYYALLLYSLNTSVNKMRFRYT